MSSWCCSSSLKILIFLNWLRFSACFKKIFINKSGGRVWCGLHRMLSCSEAARWSVVTCCWNSSFLSCSQQLPAGTDASWTAARPSHLRDQKHTINAAVGSSNCSILSFRLATPWRQLWSGVFRSHTHPCDAGPWGPSSWPSAGSAWPSVMGSHSWTCLLLKHRKPVCLIYHSLGCPLPNL